jgi:hypothetical protein
MPRNKTLASKRAPKQASKRRTSARGWLEKQSKKELIVFILGIAQEQPRVSERTTAADAYREGGTGGALG